MRFIIIIITIASFCQSRAFIFRIINFPFDLILAKNVLEDLEVLLSGKLSLLLDVFAFHYKSAIMP